MAAKNELTAELEKAQAREKRLLELLKGLNEAVYRMAWPGGDYDYASPGVESVTGYSQRDFVEDPLRIKRAVHPDYVDYLQGELAQVESGRIPPTFEYKIIDPEGDERWILQSNQGIFDEAGNLIAIEGLMRNITVRRQAEEKLNRLVDGLEQMVSERTDEIRESETRFRSIVESLPMGMHMYRLEDDGRLVFVGANPAADRILGVDNSQFIGMTIEEAFPPLIETEVPDSYRRTAARGGPWQTEQINYEGEKIQGAFEVHAFQTTPGHMVAAFLEITERKRAEDALRESEQRYRLALSATNDGFWEWNVQTGEVSFSDRYYTMLGYEPGEFPSSFESWANLVHPDDIDGARRAIELYLSGEADVYQPEFRVKTKEGRWMWILARGDVVTYTDDGAPLLFMGTHTDIDERVRAEAERESAQKQLIQAQQEAIQELSTPVIPIMDRILVMPLVGSIDSMRARHIMRALLEGIRAHRASIIILDITGVPIVDSGVANHLNKTIQAARLKGAQTIVTGISDAVAEAIVDLGIDWNALQTLSNLQTGLIVALDKLGVKLSKT